MNPGAQHPYQNRVKPSGEIFRPDSSEVRGTRMGNRGRLHDEGKQIVRPYEHRHWIICRLDYRPPNPTASVDEDPVMPSRGYTRLFFLDEATALAAGHRPCAFCSRPRFNEFVHFWAQANADRIGSRKVNVSLMDTLLHQERITGRKDKLTYLEPVEALPQGCFISLEAEDEGWLVLEEEILRWTPAGYSERRPRPHGQVVRVLTPHSIVRAIKMGFVPEIHRTEKRGS